MHFFLVFLCAMSMYAIGVPRTLSVMFCPCESDVVKLIKLNYWPATPTRPSIAFSFSLLDWLEALLLECQVALHDATEAIAFLIKEKMECVCYIISWQICGLFIVMPCQLYTLFIALNIDALQVVPCPDRCLWRVPVSILILIMLLVSMKIYSNFCGCTGTWKGKSAHLSVFPLCLEKVQFVQRVQRQVSCANASVNLSQINNIINK